MWLSALLGPSNILYADRSEIVRPLHRRQSQLLIKNVHLKGCTGQAIRVEGPGAQLELHNVVLSNNAGNSEGGLVYHVT